MEPATATLLAGGLAAGQGLISSAFNAWQSNKQERFQERMSSTAHQREVSDLRKAGLNPMLSARHGGASAPSGSSAQASSPDVAGTAIQSAQAKAQIRLADANSALATAQAGDVNLTQQQRIDLLIAQKRLALQQADATDYGKLKTEQEIKNLQAQKELINQQTTSSAFDASKKEVQSELWKIPGDFIKGAKKSFQQMHQTPGRPRDSSKTFNHKTFKKVWKD